MPITLRSVLRTGSTAVVSLTVTSGRTKPLSAWEFSLSNWDWMALRFFPARANKASAVLSEIEPAGMAESVIPASEAIETSSPAPGEFGPVTTSRALAPCSRAISAL